MWSSLTETTLPNKPLKHVFLPVVMWQTYKNRISDLGCGLQKASCGGGHKVT